MAKVTRHYETHDIVEMVPVATSKTVNFYTLELSEQEALVVKMLCGNIYGFSNVRSLSSDIYNALSEAGINNVCPRPFDFNTSITVTKDLPNA